MSNVLGGMRLGHFMTIAVKSAQGEKIAVADLEHGLAVGLNHGLVLLH